MYYDFDKVFSDKRQTGLPIPEAMIDHLNEQLPSGLHYVMDEHCLHVEPVNGAPLRFGGVSFNPTEEQKAILGDTYTEKDVLAFSYNAQERIPLRLDRDGLIIINDKELPLSMMIQSPHNPVSFIDGALYILPEEFDPPFTLCVGSDKYKQTLMIKRVPNKSVHIWAFEADESKPLIISYQLDTKKNTMSMNISFNLAAAHTIRDYVEAIAIYNAFIEGKGYIGGVAFPSRLVGEQARKFNDESLSFWEKVLQIETLLDVSFIPPHEDVEFDTICNVEQLYQNLIKQVPIRDTNKIDSIDGNWTFERQDTIKKSIGHALHFEFEATTKITLFGVDLALPCFLMVFNSVLTDAVQEGGKYKLILGNESETKSRFTSVLCFKDHDSMTTYKSGERNAMITAFHDAKRAREYVIGTS